MSLQFKLQSCAIFINIFIYFQDLKVRTERKVEKLEEECKEEDKAHWQRVSQLQKHNKVSERLHFIYI